MIQNKMGETTLADNDYVLVLLSIEEKKTTLKDCVLDWKCITFFHAL